MTRTEALIAGLVVLLALALWSASRLRFADVDGTLVAELGLLQNDPDGREVLRRLSEDTSWPPEWPPEGCLFLLVTIRGREDELRELREVFLTWNLAGGTRLEVSGWYKGGWDEFTSLYNVPDDYDPVVLQVNKCRTEWRQERSRDLRRPMRVALAVIQVDRSTKTIAAAWSGGRVVCLKNGQVSKREIEGSSAEFKVADIYRR